MIAERGHVGSDYGYMFCDEVPKIGMVEATASIVLPEDSETLARNKDHWPNLITHPGLYSSFSNPGASGLPW
jgi:hypothetical protein